MVPIILLLCTLSLLTFAQSTKQVPSPEKRQTLAEVNGKEISAAEMERTLEVQLAQLEEQIYQLKRHRLEVLIAEKLLTQEAERRAISLQALLDLEINTKAGAVSEKDIEAFYQANQSQIGGQLDINLKERIRSYLQNQRANSRRDEFIQSLRATAKIEINLPLPNVRIKTGIEGAPFKGSANAPITIIEFSDFHCPFCKEAQRTLGEIAARYGMNLNGVPAVGDSLRDLEASAKLGARPYLVLTGKGTKTQAKGGLPEGTQIYPDLAAVVATLI